MQRTDVRCKVNLPVKLLKTNGEQGAVEKNAAFSVLSLNGAFIDYKYPIAEQKVVGLRYQLPRYGEFDVLGKVVRSDTNGIAVQFYNVSRDTKIKLWDYIKENIVEDNMCPYCRGENVQKVSACSKCGWHLNFYSPDYLIQHERESFINRLAARSKALSVEEINKVLNFIDVEILGIGKSWDINEEFVGSSNKMLEVFSNIRKAASADLTVLITGERGTGKELTARAVYERSSRKGRPFVYISCSAIPESMQETEIFGRGGEDVVGGSPGKLEYADGGTVFINDIDNLSPDLYRKFLKFLDDRVVVRAGARSGKKADVRIVLASRLRPSVLKESFLKKLNAFNINLPPVRERDEDKIILARYFLNKFSRELNVSKTFSNDALEAIKHYEWPGNVREIINKVRTAILMSHDADIRVSDLNLDVPQMDISSLTTLRDVKSAIEKKKLAEALKFSNNNISKTAKILGISRPSVYSFKKKYGL